MVIASVSKRVASDRRFIANLNREARSEAAHSLAHADRLNQSGHPPADIRKILYELLRVGVEVGQGDVAVGADEIECTAG
jgi:hypothetical protein